MKKKSLIKNFIQTPFLSFVFLFLLVPALSLGQIAGWSPASLTAYGPSPWSSTTTNANLTVGGLTRGSGVGISGTAAAAAWGGRGGARAAAQQPGRRGGRGPRLGRGSRRSAAGTQRRRVPGSN